MFTYPRNLPGLAYSKIRRPKFNTGIQTHQSGGEYRTAYQSEALWEFELTYELLRDGFRMGRAFDELKQVEGLYLAMNGALIGFQFFDDDDHSATRTQIASSDGRTTSFTLKRYRGSYAFGGPGGFESIGLL